MQRLQGLLTLFIFIEDSNCIFLIRINCTDQVLISMSVEEFNSWQKDSFDPEDFFFETLQDIDGITSIEAQTYKVSEGSKFYLSFFYHFKKYS